MLAFHLDLRDAGPAHRWQWKQTCWTNGGSWLRPLGNPILNSSMVVRDGQVRFVVREAQPFDNSVELGSWTAQPRRLEEYDHVGVDVSAAGITVTLGHQGAAPLYLVADGSVVRGTWNIADLRSAMLVADLCDRAVVRALTRRHRYSSDTLFTTIHRLTERATATFGPRGLVVNYPDPVSHIVRARAIRPDVDIVAAFDGLLHSAVRQRIPIGRRVGVELSGGVDSANVALTVSTAAQESAVSCYGLILDGTVGRQQQQRRRAVLDHLGLSDVAIKVRAHPSFAVTGVRGLGRPHDPVGAYYREAFDALRDRAAADDVAVMFTGLCGDELMALRPDESDVAAPEPVLVPWLGGRAIAALPDVETNLAPIGVLPLPTLMAFALHNPSYLMAGIMPVSPLADPIVLRLGEQLPVSWRRNKELLRSRLARAGLPAEVARPARPETFSGLMQLGLRQHGLNLLRGMLAESILVDTGFVDHTQLAAAYRRARGADAIPSLLCDTIALEVGLRSLLDTVEVT